LNAKQVEYLLVGGYAVGYHGYPRSTLDIDVWVAVHSRNAGKLVEALREFGFTVPDLNESKFLNPDRIIQMGREPVRIEIFTGLKGVSFEECFGRKVVAQLDGTPVNLISLDDLKAAKRAAGRHQDLNDLEHLP
jgi:predicted nucleotidyltransferase